MDIIQSFITAVARQGFTQWEAKIYYSILKELQSSVAAHPLETSIVCESVNVHLNSAEVLQESRHSELFRAAMEHLCSKTITYVLLDQVNKRPVEYITPLVYNVSHVHGSSLYNCQVAKSFVSAFTNMSKGYVKFNLENLVQLSSVYSMRLYALLGSQANRTTLNYAISTLRNMFGIDGLKYKQTSDFIKRCIEPAARELSEMRLNGFDYTTETRGGKIVGIKFTTITREELPLASTLAKINVGMLIPPHLKAALIEKFGFTSRELAAHKQLLFDFAQVKGYEGILSTVLEYTRARGRGKGYVIAAMRRAVGGQ